MSDPASLRKRIEKIKKETANLEGEERSLRDQLNIALDKLRAVLRCEKGEEKDALADLKRKIKESQTKIEENVSKVEKILSESDA